MTFNPNENTVDFCLKRVREAADASALDINKGITTSQDPKVKEVVSRLEVTNIPSDFVKFQLPVVFDGPTTTYLSFGAPRTKVPEHSHDEGSGIRVILSGSIIYEGLELTAGDWMYIPKGVSYKFVVGDMGVGMFYCYECCCA